MSWDQHFAEQDKTQWKVVSQDLKEIPSHCFPKYIGLTQNEEIKYQLLVFCDASKYAYAAAVYLRQEIQEKGCKVDLIFSKTKLVPNKQITIPRLELLAATIGVRCIKFVQEEVELELSQKHIWVDLQCVINWINRKRALKTFAENIVKEIKQHKHLKVHYMSMTENPADIASRGMRSHELKDNRLWCHEPKWLTQSNQELPERQHDLSKKQKQEVQSQTETEYRKSQIIFEEQLVAWESPIGYRLVEPTAPFNIYIDRFSSLTRLLRVTPLAERFINNLTKKDNK